MSKRSRLLAAAGVIVSVLAVVAVGLRRGDAVTRYATAEIDRGRIEEVVGATGVLQAVTTVQIGSQVSGTIQTLAADFNSTVTRGQVIARLDPSLFEARVAQMGANLAAARAQVERAQAAIDDTRQKYARARELAERQLLPQADLDSARAAHDGALAQLKANQAAVSQAQAALHQAEVDLAHTVIRAPIDGVVLARDVDVGQTVAASFQAPVLFVIANDLTRMQVNAAIDEADVGRVRAGQAVNFRVDAHPERTFAGRVEQVRLRPTTTQNVVTYNTIIAVDNPDLALMPGMTATVSVIVAARDGVLRLPAAALRFRPAGFEERTRSFAERRAVREGATRADGAPPRDGGDRRGGRRGDAAEERRPGGEERGGAGRPGLVFVLGDGGQPRPARVRTGLSDGRFVELVEGLDEGLDAGARVVTGTDDAGRPATRPSDAGASNPFSPQRPRPRVRE